MALWRAVGFVFAPDSSTLLHQPFPESAEFSRRQIVEAVYFQRHAFPRVAHFTVLAFRDHQHRARFVFSFFVNKSHNQSLQRTRLSRFSCKRPVRCAGSLSSVVRPRKRDVRCRKLHVHGFPAAAMRSVDVPLIRAELYWVAPKGAAFTIPRSQRSRAGAVPIAYAPEGRTRRY